MKNLRHIAAMRSTAIGFTLVELMITLTLAAVLAGVAAPSMRTFVLNSRLTGTSNAMLRSIQTARTEAIKRQTNVVMCMSANPTAATPTCATSGLTGWIVFQDDSKNWDHESTETVLEARTFESSKISVISNNSKKVSFATTGFATPTGTVPASQTNSTSIVLCDSRGNASVNGGQSTARGISISNTGRTGAAKTQSAVSTLLGSATCP